MLIKPGPDADQIREIWRHMVFASVPHYGWWHLFRSRPKPSTPPKGQSKPRKSAAAAEIEPGKFYAVRNFGPRITLHTSEEYLPHLYLWPFIEATISLGIKVPPVMPTDPFVVPVSDDELQPLMFRLMEIREMARDPASDFFEKGPVLFEAQLIEAGMQPGEC